MLTLAEAKLHLRVDHTDDDSYIEGLVAVASEYIGKLCTPAATEEVPEPVPPAVNATQKHAARLLVGHWYAHREAVSEVATSEVPMAVSMLLAINRPAGSWI